MALRVSRGNYFALQ